MAAMRKIRSLGPSHRARNPTPAAQTPAPKLSPRGRACTYCISQAIIDGVGRAAACGPVEDGQNGLTVAPNYNLHHLRQTNGSAFMYITHTNRGESRG